MFRLFRRYLGAHKISLALIILLQALQSVLSLLLPSLNGQIINGGVLTGNIDFIINRGMIMLAIALVQVAIVVSSVYVGVRMAIAFGKTIRSDIFQRVMSLSIREVSNLEPSSLVTRSTNDVQIIQFFTMFFFTVILSAPLTLVAGIVMALRENIELSLSLLLVIPILAITVLLVVRNVSPLFQKMQIQLDGINQIVREQIQGIRVIRAFTSEEKEIERFEKANSDIYQTYISTFRTMSLLFPMVFFIFNTCMMAIYYFSAGLLERGSMQIGSLIAFTSYLLFILFAVMMSAMMLFFYPRARVSAARVLEVLDTESSVEFASGSGSAAAARKFDANARKSGVAVEFKHVTFQYPNAKYPVLWDLNFRANPGEITAIIGSTGSGKSTTAKLFPRLFDASFGEVLLNGIDIKSISQDELNEIVSIVPQSNFLFSGTIKSNLLMGDKKAKDAKLNQALKTAHASEFVKSLKDEVSQGGSNFSGGQKQRLTIARALVKDAEVFVFDDSFSALDYATDSKLRHSLKHDLADKTLVIVAQRVSTIRQAEKIIVLDEGRIVGEGTHDQLLKTSDTYREIVKSQMKLED